MMYPYKEIITLGQTYFVIQAHGQEVADAFNQLDEEVLSQLSVRKSRG